MDNIFIERPWRWLTYERVHLHAWETGSQAKAGVGAGSPSAALSGLTPRMADDRLPWFASIVSKPINSGRL